MTKIDTTMDKGAYDCVAFNGHCYSMRNHPLKAPLRDGDIVVVEDKLCIVVTCYGGMVELNDVDTFGVIAPLILLKDIWGFTTTNKRDYADVGFSLKKTWCKHGLTYYVWDRWDVDWRIYNNQ